MYNGNSVEGVQMMKSNNPVFRFDNMVTLAKGRIPGQVIIQFTDRCNAKCPQ